MKTIDAIALVVIIYGAATLFAAPWLNLVLDSNSLNIINIERCE